MRQIGFISAMVLLSACSSASDDDERSLAEVETDALTYGEVKTAIPYAVWQADSSNATNEYVKQWTMSRLLATEAERLGLHELSDVAERIRIHRDDVLIETLRDRALNSLTDEIRVTESEIEAYFEMEEVWLCESISSGEMTMKSYLHWPGQPFKLGTMGVLRFIDRLFRTHPPLLQVLRIAPLGRRCGRKMKLSCTPSL